MCSIILHLVSFFLILLGSKKTLPFETVNIMSLYMDKFLLWSFNALDQKVYRYNCFAQAPGAIHSNSLAVMQIFQFKVLPFSIR